MPYIRIRADNGYPECTTCTHIESGTCEFCDEADQWEEADEDSLRTRNEPELLAA